MAENGLITPPRFSPMPTTPPRLVRQDARCVHLSPSCADSWRKFVFPHVGVEEWELWRAILTPQIPASSPPFSRQNAFSGPPFQRD